MCSIKCVVGTWLGISCFSEFYVGFSTFELKSDYINNKAAYNSLKIYLSTEYLDLLIFMSFLLGIFLAITLYCWLSGNKKAKACAAVSGIIYGILQTIGTIAGSMPVLFILPALMVYLIIKDLQR